MERRKFLRSFGLLGLASIFAPKLLADKKEPYQPYKLIGVDEADPKWTSSMSVQRDPKSVTGGEVIMQPDGTYRYMKNSSLVKEDADKFVVKTNNNFKDNYGIAEIKNIEDYEIYWKDQGSGKIISGGWSYYINYNALKNGEEL